MAFPKIYRSDKDTWPYQQQDNDIYKVIYRYEDDKKNWFINKRVPIMRYRQWWSPFACQWWKFSVSKSSYHTSDLQSLTCKLSRNILSCFCYQFGQKLRLVEVELKFHFKSFRFLPSQPNIRILDQLNARMALTLFCQVDKQEWAKIRFWVRL